MMQYITYEKLLNLRKIEKMTNLELSLPKN